MDGTVLLGYAGRLWTLTHAQAIAHEEPCVAALGSGEGPAMGAMHVFLRAGCEASIAVVEAVKIGILLDRNSGGDVRHEALIGSR